MGNPKTNKDETPEEKIRRMYATLNERCPRLVPLVSPAGYSPYYAAFSSSAEKKATIEKAFAHHLSSNRSCAVCGDDDQELKVFVGGKYIFDKALFELQGAQVMCEDCRTLCDIPTCISLAVNSKSGKSKERLDRTLHHFKKLNGGDEDHNESFQEVYSLAHALLILCRNLPHFKVVDPSGALVTMETDPNELVVSLTGEKHRSGKTPGKKQKRKRSD